MIRRLDFFYILIIRQYIQYKCPRTASMKQQQVFLVFTLNILFICLYFY